MTGLYLEDHELVSLRKLIYHPYNDALVMYEGDDDVLDVLTKISKHMQELENERRTKKVESRMAANGLTRCKRCNQISNQTGGRCSNCYL
jgi:hypothetical protein